jgi:hypothetical protein
MRFLGSEWSNMLNPKVVKACENKMKNLTKTLKDRRMRKD